eukprot:36071-Chlamydomonas_euryale.AAC.9
MAAPLTRTPHTRSPHSSCSHTRARIGAAASYRPAPPTAAQRVAGARAAGRPGVAVRVVEGRCGSVARADARARGAATHRKD